MDYTAKGRYVAVLNKPNDEGHYIRVFEYPGSEDVVWGATAVWYYLNRIDSFGYLVAVYPIEMFSQIEVTKFICQCAWCRKIRLNDTWVELPEEARYSFPYGSITHGICPTCKEHVLENYRRSKVKVEKSST